MDTQLRPYRVELSDAAVRSLRRFPRDDQRRILAQIERLAANPQEMAGVKRLVDYDIAYRLHVGDYRVLFDRDDVIRIIDVVDVLPRGRAYRRK